MRSWKTWKSHGIWTKYFQAWRSHGKLEIANTKSHGKWKWCVNNWMTIWIVLGSTITLTNLHKILPFFGKKRLWNSIDFPWRSHGIQFHKRCTNPVCIIIGSLAVFFTDPCVPFVFFIVFIANEDWINNDDFHLTEKDHSSWETEGELWSRGVVFRTEMGRWCT